MARRNKNNVIKNLLVDSYAAEGKSVAHLEDGKVIFIENAIPGDRVDVRIVKDKKSWAEGKVEMLIAASKQRIEPFCEHFGLCGGCKWQMLPYSLQLQYKQQQVYDQLNRIGKLTLPTLLPIIGSEHTTYYRNKLEFTFSNQRYRTIEEIKERSDKFEPEPALGFHAPGLFDKVVPINQCYLQGGITSQLLQWLKGYTIERGYSYYDARRHEGMFRNVIIRVATTGDVLVNLIFGTEDEGIINETMDALYAQFPAITSLHYTINTKLNDSIYDLDVVPYKGKPFIIEKLGEYSFKISPKSFFQTNSLQATVLYNVVAAFAGLTGSEVVYDLYCGTGSIGIYCSAGAKRVIGIELIEDAIKDAKENASLNGLTNCTFYFGDVAALYNDSLLQQHGKPDVIITDPPRAGMSEKLINQLIHIKAPKVVYVSCNPATQARDLQLLEGIYAITKVQPVDMFPHTHHIENVALLELK
ncbi:MAG: 23S rRNA (uracil(1939)-C(5))-methyltransferase RlmD [Chitinophagia bacterium]|nr:23S rRNA (uracil(1939)-C(5))-methyltransferase RlmD [Chitinophagia bacterium]